MSHVPHVNHLISSPDLVGSCHLLHFMGEGTTAQGDLPVCHASREPGLEPALPFSVRSQKPFPQDPGKGGLGLFGFWCTKRLPLTLAWRGKVELLSWS